MTRAPCYPLAVPLALLVLGTAHAQQETVLGKDVAKRTKTVMTSIDWKRSLEEVEEAATKSGKMIFWLQIVGDLDDGL